MREDCIFFFLPPKVELIHFSEREIVAHALPICSLPPLLSHNCDVCAIIPRILVRPTLIHSAVSFVYVFVRDRM